MAVPRVLRLEFNREARDISCDDRFQPGMPLMIDGQSFEEMFKPIVGIFQKGRFYAGNRPLDLLSVISEMRTMCLEAQTTHTTLDGCTRERRTELLNVLQGIREAIEDNGAGKNGIFVPGEEFFALPGLTDVIREAAMTHREFLHNEDVAQGLMDVAKNIERAQKQCWGVMAADDYMSDKKRAA